MNKGIATTGKKTKKSRLQIRYEKLLEDIKNNKELEQNLEEDMQKVMPMIQKDIFPLLRQKNELFKKRLLRLDELSYEIGVGKYNQEYFDDYMQEQSASLLSETGFVDEELKELSKRYNNGEDIIDKDIMAQMIKDTTGIDIDIEEAMNVGFEEYLKNNHESLREQLADAQENEEKKQLEDFDPNATKKVSKEEQLIAQDAKTIYMRLVKKFHPDLEQDEKLKIKKTALVQRITNAYKENDFLELLNLQIQYLDEKENEGVILADDMLKRYNKILKRQLDEILENIEYIKQNSGGLYDDFFDKNSKFSKRRFNTYIKNLKLEIEDLEEDIRQSYKRKKGWFKEWIKEIKDLTMENMFENAFFNIFNR